jgi:hypothetical protein
MCKRVFKVVKAFALSHLRLELETAKIQVFT